MFSDLLISELGLNSIVKNVRTFVAISIGMTS